MKAKINTKALLSAITALIKVVPSKAALPIIENFLVSAEDGGVTILATDQETSLKTLLPTDVASLVKDAGMAVLPARLLLEIVKEIQDETVTLETRGENGALLIWNRGQGQMPAFAVDDFPAIAFDLKEHQSFEMPSDELDKAIAATVYATADDQIRPQMNGIKVEPDTNGLTFAASDSHRLAWREVPSVVSAEKGAGFILPKKCAGIIRNLTGLSEKVTISYDDNNAVLAFGDTTLSVRLVVGKFPKWRDVIPRNSTGTLRINRKELITVLRRVSVCSNKTSNHVRMSLKEGVPGTLEIKAQDLGFALAAYERLNADYTGDELAIGLKAAFLIETLNTLDGEDVELKFTDPKRAFSIKNAEEPDAVESRTGAILMPVQTS